jgi:UDPglucose 6-dehydrogenase
VDFSLLREVARVNARRVDVLCGKLEQALWVLRGKTVGVLGVAFKPDTDDIRDAPSLRVIARLLESGATLRIYDPRAAARMAAAYPPGAGVAYVASAYEAARGAHALAILTEWGEFGDLDLRRVRGLMRTPVVVDGRNLFVAEEMRTHGFEYYGLGRAVPVPASVPA